jgi:hypothetical protein
VVSRISLRLRSSSQINTTGLFSDSKGMHLILFYL